MESHLAYYSDDPLAKLKLNGNIHGQLAWLYLSFKSSNFEACMKLKHHDNNNFALIILQRKPTML